MNEMKNKVLTDIKAKRAAKQGNKRKREEDDKKKENKKPKLDTNELTRLIQEAQSKNTYSELEPILKKIDAYEGEIIYKENKAKIEKLKSKLISLNSGDYKNKLVNRLKARVDKLKNKLGNRTPALINELEQLRNTSDANAINRIERSINNELGQLEANVTLGKLIKELKTAITKKDNKKASSKIKEIKEFNKSTNVYQQASYSQKKNNLEKLFSQAEHLDQKQTHDNDKGIAP